MQRSYGVDEMIRVFPAYIEFAQHMRDANEIISGSRETRSQRTADYARLESEYISNLIATYERLRFSETLALSSAKRKRFTDRTALILGTLAAVYALWEPIHTAMGFVETIF